jgi:hypothetical protein
MRSTVGRKDGKERRDAKRRRGQSTGKIRGDWRETRERKNRKPEKRKRTSKEENGDPENAVE